jgi:hypothetical protein
MVSVICPGCGKSFRGKEEFAGKRVKCPKCGKRFEYPSFSALSTEVSAAATIPAQDTAARLVMQVVDVKWPSRPGVLANELKCYGCGIGSEYVYCYSYPTHVEMAELKNESRFRIKVGKAVGNPIERIYQQFSGNKTARSEPPVVLLLFQTLASRHLESWLHKQLDRAADAGGSEWFHTNPDELVKLFQRYLRDASHPVVEPSNSNSSKAEYTVRNTAATPKFARIGPATSVDDVVISVRPRRYRKSTTEITTNKMRESRRLDEVIDRAGRITVGQICAETGYSLQRVLSHVNWFIDRGSMSLEGLANSQQQTVSSDESSAEKPRSSAYQRKKKVGRAIQALMNSGQYTVDEIAEKAGCSAKRVWSHIHWLNQTRERAVLNDKNQVVMIGPSPPFRD